MHNNMPNPMTNPTTNPMTSPMDPANRFVSVAAGPSTYDAPAPYSPTNAFPEYPFPQAPVSQKPNPVYETVRNALACLETDPEHVDTPQWNPLRGHVQPGDTVVLKPNFVRDFRETHSHHGDCIITHGAVIRAAVDYAYIALAGKGRIVIADAPQNDADFQEILNITQLQAIQAFYKQYADFEVEVYDLRPERAEKVDGVIVGHKTLPGDPAGYVRVNLASRSAFAPINDLCHLLYGSEYDTAELFSHQHDDVHEYLISKTVLDADCVISLPKLKTHKKVGLTVNLKNLVGINGNKNWLPHHREGTPSQGGDQFADNALKRRVERKTVMQFKQLFPLLGPLRPIVAGPIKAVGKRIFGDTNTDTIRSGNWYGNDTTWRMVLDLNRILFYADADGALHDQPVRRFFSIVDGIIAGQGNGPLDPVPMPAGVILAGTNPVAVDMTCANLMGFDRSRLQIIQRALEEHPLPLMPFDAQQVISRANDDRFAGPLDHWAESALDFKPHFGWIGHVERPGKSAPAA
jgi:uncharacterized protein (DUF362 family)